MRVNKINVKESYTMIFPYKTLSKVVKVIEVDLINKEITILFPDGRYETLNQIEVERYIKKHERN